MIGKHFQNAKSASCINFLLTYRWCFSVCLQVFLFSFICNVFLCVSRYFSFSLSVMYFCMCPGILLLYRNLWEGRYHWADIRDYRSRNSQHCLHGGLCKCMTPLLAYVMVAQAQHQKHTICRGFWLSNRTLKHHPSSLFFLSFILCHSFCSSLIWSVWCPDINLATGFCKEI